MRHVGVEQTFKSGGRRYRLSRLTRGVLRAWLEWADSQAPSPLLLAAQYVHDFPCPEILVDVAESMAAVRMTADDDVVRELEPTAEGQFRFFLLLMQKYHFDVTEGRLWKIFRRLEDWQGMMAKASGVVAVDDMDVERQMYVECGFVAPLADNDHKHDWGETDRSIFTNCYRLPSEVDDMTLPEIITVLHSEKKPQGVRGSIASLAAGSITRFYHQLTPAQKLELATRKYGF